MHYFVLSLLIFCPINYIVPSRPPVVTKAMIISPMEVEFSWLEVDLIHQNGIITVYEVDYQPLTDFGSEDVTRVNTTNTTIVLMDLHESVQYNITVRAFTSVGGGPFSNPVASVTHEAGITVRAVFYLGLGSPPQNCIY